MLLWLLDVHIMIVHAVRLHWIYLNIRYFQYEDLIQTGIWSVSDTATFSRRYDLILVFGCHLFPSFRFTFFILIQTQCHLAVSSSCCTWIHASGLAILRLYGDLLSAKCTFSNSKEIRQSEFLPHVLWFVRPTAEMSLCHHYQFPLLLLPPHNFFPVPRLSDFYHLLPHLTLLSNLPPRNLHVVFLHRNFLVEGVLSRPK